MEILTYIVARKPSVKDPTNSAPNEIPYNAWDMMIIVRFLEEYAMIQMSCELIDSRLHRDREHGSGQKEESQGEEESKEDEWCCRFCPVDQDSPSLRTDGINDTRNQEDSSDCCRRQ